MRKFALVVVFLTGCSGTFVPIHSLDKIGLDAISAAQRLRVVSQSELALMRSLGEGEGHSCQNKIFVGEPASTRVGAFDQLRIAAAQIGATAISEPVCEAGGYSLLKNCFKSATYFV